MNTIERANEPAGYRQKFRNFIKLCDQTKAGDVVVIATPDVLGVNHEELIESLSRLADAQVMLAIAQRSRRGLAAENVEGRYTVSR